MGQKRIALESRTKSGFSLIEIVIALAIMGLLLTIAVPNVQRLRPGYERNRFVSTLSNLVQRAWQNALVTHELHRVWFDVKQRRVVVQRALDKRDQMGEPMYQEISSEYVAAEDSWPESLQFKDFFIDGVDVLHAPGMRIHEFWFFVFPDGNCQEVILNIFDTSDTTESEAGTRLSLVLNPFSARFTQYATFQKP